MKANVLKTVLILLALFMPINAMAVDNGIFEDFRARYYTDPGASNADIPEVSVGLPGIQDADGTAVQYFPNGLCLYQQQGTGEIDPVFGGASFGPPANGVWVDSNAGSYDFANFNTTILTYWANWDHPIPAVCADDNGQPIQTNTAQAIPRPYLYNTHLLENGTTVEGCVQNYTDQYQDGRLVLRVSGGNYVFINSSVLTLGGDTIWNQGPGNDDCGEGFPNGNKFRFSLNHSSFNGLVPEDGEVTATLLAFASFQTLSNDDLASLTFDDLEGFPPANLQMSATYADSQTIVINNEETAPPAPPTLTAVTLVADPADVQLVWRNNDGPGDEVDDYDRIDVYRNGFKISGLDIEGDNETVLLPSEPIGQSHQYYLVAVVVDEDDEEEVESANSNDMSSPLLVADPPTITDVTGGENQILVSAQLPEGTYANQNEIVGTEICVTGSVSQCPGLAPFPLSPAVLVNHPVVGLNAGTYQVAVRVVLANGEHSNFSVAATGITVNDPFNLDPPPVLGQHVPVMDGNNASSNPDEFYRVTFSIPVDSQSDYDRVELFDGFSNEEIGELNPGNGYTLNLPVDQVGTGNFEAIGYVSSFSSNPGGVEIDGGIPIIRPDVYLAIQGDDGAKPGRILEVYATITLPNNLHTEFSNQKLRVVDNWTEEPVAMLTHEFSISPGSSDVRDTIEYPADLSGWGPHTITATIVIENGAGTETLAESPNNTAGVRLGVRQWNVNHGAPVDSHLLSTFMHENADFAPGEEYVPGDFIFWYLSLAMEDINDPSAGYRGPEPKCHEVTNSNRNAFVVRRRPTPPGADECTTCYDLAALNPNDDFTPQDCDEDPFWENWQYCYDDPWNNTDASLPENPWGRCMGPNFNGTDINGQALTRINPADETPLFITEDYADWYDDTQDEQQNWSVLWFAEGPDQYSPPRGKPPGFYAVVPPRPGECVETAPGHTVCYDSNNSCMTDYVHNQENGAYNQYGAPCVDTTDQAGFPNEWEAEGDLNGFAL